MDLILWRHAEAQEHPQGEQGEQGDALDLARRLTPRGEKQAARMAAWLDRQLPEGTRIWSSPAARTEQTAQTVQALGRKYRVSEALAPGASPAHLLELVQWPGGRSPVLVVGHQPTLGRVVAQLLDATDPTQPWSVRKGAVWWLRLRDREGVPQLTLHAVVGPDTV